MLRACSDVSGGYETFTPSSLNGFTAQRRVRHVGRIRAGTSGTYASTTTPRIVPDRRTMKRAHQSGSDGVIGQKTWDAAWTAPTA